MPLIKNGKVTEDSWIYLGADEPGDRDIIVTLERWQTDRDALISRPGRLGIRLAAGEPPHLIADDLPRFGVVALEFPAFKDGRAYSYARLLRERYGYRGELRAVGDVLRDQFLFMARCGFDAFETADEISPQTWHETLTEFSAFYQPTGDGRTPVYDLRHGLSAAAE